MAAIMKEHLGPFLLTDKVVDEDALEELPSPEVSEMFDVYHSDLCPLPSAPFLCLSC